MHRRKQDYSICSSARPGTVRPSALAVLTFDHKLELDRPQHRQNGGLLTLQKAKRQIVTTVTSVKARFR
jgi:hypothetical protein